MLSQEVLRQIFDLMKSDSMKKVAPDGSWALTGGAAIMAHCLAAGVDMALEDFPEDVDIIVKQESFAEFALTLRPAVMGEENCIGFYPPSSESSDCRLSGEKYHIDILNARHWPGLDDMEPVSLPSLDITIPCCSTETLRRNIQERKNDYNDMTVSEDIKGVLNKDKRKLQLLDSIDASRKICSCIIL